MTRTRDRRTSRRISSRRSTRPPSRTSRGVTSRASCSSRRTRPGSCGMALEEWAMIAAAWVVMAAAPWWLYPVVALVVAGRLHALGVVLHDATHMPLRRKTAAVRVVEVLCGYPIASTLNAMRYHHLRHHRDSGMHTDPYYKAGRQNALWQTLNILRGLALPPFWSCPRDRRRDRVSRAAAAQRLRARLPSGPHERRSARVSGGRRVREGGVGAGRVPGARHRAGCAVSVSGSRGATSCRSALRAFWPPGACSSSTPTSA